jgi:hypothetical protein
MDAREELKDWRGHHNEDSPRSAIGYNVPITLHYPDGITGPSSGQILLPAARTRGRCSEGEHQIPSEGTLPWGNAPKANTDLSIFKED